MTIRQVDGTDDELTAAALAADPTERLDATATPLVGSVRPDDGPLPGWYMPAPRQVAQTPRRRAIGLLIILALFAINAFGLCVTYGFLEIA